MEKIQMRKWYLQMRGFGGSASIEVAAFAEAGRTTGAGVMSLFGGKDGGIRHHEETPVLKAIGKDGIIVEIEANELKANGSIGIGSLEPRFNIPDLTDEELEELKAKGIAKVEKEKADKAEKERKREEKRQQYAKDYAYLPNKRGEGKYLTVAKIAENVRVNLKTVFAGQKFSVRSKSFSGGDDINVAWTNGPTKRMVKMETSKYEDSSTDITGDYRDYTPNAFNDVFGGTKYMWEERNYQDGFEKMIRDFCGFAEGEALQFNRDYCEGKSKMYHDVVKAWENTAFPAGAVITGIFKLDEPKEVNTGYCTEDIYYGFKFDAPEQKKPTTPKGGKVTKVDGVTVTINEEKHGVEIRFPSKPSAEIIDTLKKAGFRWTRFGGCWYHKDTPRNREVANALAA